MPAVGRRVCARGRARCIGGEARDGCTYHLEEGGTELRWSQGKVILVSNGSNMWDLEAFYDSLDPLRVFDSALAQGFPPVILLLEMLIHLAPRVLRCKQAVSLPIHPQRSIKLIH